MKVRKKGEIDEEEKTSKKINQKKNCFAKLSAK
jgi:hypothetical protein